MSVKTQPAIGRKKGGRFTKHVDCRGLECLDYRQYLCFMYMWLQKMHCKESPVFAVVTFYDKEGDCVS